MVQSDILNFYKIKHGFCGVELTANKENFFDSVDLYLKFRKSIDVKEIWILRQYHSTKICDKHYATMGDGIISRYPNRAMCVKTADCIPLLLFDNIRHVGGAVHISAKNARLGIVEKALNAFLSKSPESCHAILGPCLERESYQVANDFLHLFPEKYYYNENGKFFFDLKCFVIDEIKKYKNSFKHFEVEDTKINTFNDTRFHSYRREAKTHLRNISYIAL